MSGCGWSRRTACACGDSAMDELARIVVVVIAVYLVLRLARSFDASEWDN